MKPLRGNPAADPKQARLVQELKHASPLIGGRFSPCGRLVAAGAQDNTVLVWELASGKKTVLVGHKSWVRGLAFHPHEPLLFSGDYAGRLLAWRYRAAPQAHPLQSVDFDPRAAAEPAWAIDAHKGWLRALAVSSDGKLVATCGNDHLVKLWSSADGKPVLELPGHDCHVYNVAFHPDGRHLVSADLKGVVRQWDLASGSAVRALDGSALYKYDNSFRADIGGIRGMAFDAAGTLLACAGITEVTNAFAGVGKPLVVLFDWATGKVKQRLTPKETFQGTGWGVAFHPAGFLVGAGGGNGGALWFWKPDQPQAYFTLKLPTNARDLSLHANSARLAVPCNDGAVRIYSLWPRKPA